MDASARRESAAALTDHQKNEMRFAGPGIRSRQHSRALRFMAALARQIVDWRRASAAPMPPDGAVLLPLAHSRILYFSAGGT